MKPVSKKPKTVKVQASKLQEKESHDGRFEDITQKQSPLFFVAWEKIVMRIAHPRAVKPQPLSLNVKVFLPPVTACRCCIVHGDKAGWVCLQMHAGHTWVPRQSPKDDNSFPITSLCLPIPSSIR